MAERAGWFSLGGLSCIRVPRLQQPSCPHQSRKIPSMSGGVRYRNMDEKDGGEEWVVLQAPRLPLLKVGQGTLSSGIFCFSFSFHCYSRIKHTLIYSHSQITLCPTGEILAWITPVLDNWRRESIPAGLVVCWEAVGLDQRRAATHEGISKTSGKPLVDRDDRTVILLDLLFPQRHPGNERDVEHRGSAPPGP